MSKFSSKIKLAKRLIGENGQDVTWVKQNELANVNQPWKSVAGAADGSNKFPCKILFLKEGSGTFNALFHLIKGSDAVTGAPKGLMAPQDDFTPEMTDSVVRDGSVMVIKSVNPLAPNGELILYTIEFA